MDKYFKIDRIATVIGDPSRLRMLIKLMDGRAYTATELSLEADIAPSTASAHLSKLLEIGALALEAQGRHRYYRLQDTLIATTIETIMALTSDGKRDARGQGPTQHDPIKTARLCYDHLAGTLGVGITQSLEQSNFIFKNGKQFLITDAGRDFFGRFQINVDQLNTGRRQFAACCLDWSERQHHIAGAVGAAIAKHSLEVGWVKRVADSRVLIITPQGSRALQENFDIKLPSA